MSIEGRIIEGQADTEDKTLSGPCKLVSEFSYTFSIPGEHELIFDLQWGDKIFKKYMERVFVSYENLYIVGPPVKERGLFLAGGRLSGRYGRTSRHKQSPFLS